MYAVLFSGDNHEYGWFDDAARALCWGTLEADGQIVLVVRRSQPY
jgi:hypothetical protein